MLFSGKFAETMIIITVFLIGISVLLIKIHHVLILKPKTIRSKLRKQGIDGPSPAFFYGNIPQIKEIQFESRSVAATPASENEQGGRISHDWPAVVFPHIERWRKQYGPIFLYTTGNIHMMAVVDPEMVKEISLCSSLNLGKPSYLSTERGPLLGQGILTSNGPFWAHQRKIIAPEFYLAKVKVMVNLIVDSTMKVLESWESEIGEIGNRDVEIKVDEDMRSLSADIISRACFGSSYSLGKGIFTKLHSLLNVMSKVSLGVPGLRHVPIKHNREIWRLSREIDTAILDVVNIRRQTSHEKDLLQLILDAAENEGATCDLPNNVTPNKFIIDNCKNIYLAGHETTATSSSWCLMLLAAYPEWQERIRQEVLQVCGHEPPDAEKLTSMKMLTMFIQEALRLYPPVAYVIKEALQDIDLKGILIPKGVTVQIIISFLHQNPDLWGSDAHVFNPERFSKGITNACKVPQAYMPFGLGTRICVGQHFAMAELKVILSLILLRFSLSLSPDYTHSPAFQMVIQPKHGVILHLRKI